ncbi:C-glycoside deglycosidase beta subunit domain-containing protein [Leifsonia sp. L25]|uniref:C-glycoside deglycosidase beta subunit domain-containing protein n=1 Tax=Leifsonia sp. L25 TaxID=3423957 RepID=UPI003D682BFC
MLEEQLIQTSGFRNVGPAGARTGFQLRVRSPYYRGLWANLIEKPAVTVDGERFGGDDIRWTLPTGHATVGSSRSPSSRSRPTPAGRSATQRC